MHFVVLFCTPHNINSISVFYVEAFMSNIYIWNDSRCSLVAVESWDAPEGKLLPKTEPEQN